MGLFHLTHYSVSSREAKVRSFRQDLKQRMQNNVFTGLFSIFLYNLETPAQEWHYPQWDGHSHTNYYLRKYNQANLTQKQIKTPTESHN